MIYGLTQAKAAALSRLHIIREGHEIEPVGWTNPFAWELALRRWAQRNDLLERINDQGDWDMNIKDLHEALGRMIESGDGDAEIAHVNGVGKASRVLGWELVTASAYEPARGAQQRPAQKQLKLHTTARF